MEEFEMTNLNKKNKTGQLEIKNESTSLNANNGQPEKINEEENENLFNRNVKTNISITNLKQFLKKKETKKIILYYNLLNILLNIISFSLYIYSLKGCDSYSSDVECLLKLTPSFFYKLGICAVISAMIIIIEFYLSCFIKLISRFHFIYVFIFYLFIFSYDNGTSLYKHGHYNIIIFLFSLIFFFILFAILWIFIMLILKKMYKIIIFIISLFLILVIFKNKIFNLDFTCEDWPKGLNDEFIDNNKNKYLCEIKTPETCSMYTFDKLFDISKKLNINCETTSQRKQEQIKFNKYFYFLKKKKLIKELINKSNLTHFGFPITVNDPFFSTKNQLNTIQWSEKVFQKIVLMDLYNKEDLYYYENKVQKPEVELIFDNKTHLGKIKINITYNESLSYQRNRIREFMNDDGENSFVDNVLFIYIDSISRQHFLRKMKKTSKFIEQFMKLNESLNFTSYQFFKYHSFAPITQLNIIPMFYGINIYNETEDILKVIKEKGYVTGQSSNQCSKELYEIEEDKINKNLNFEEFDHENIAMFCDPTYFYRNKPYPIHRGPYSAIRRCLYGKDTFEYVLEYGKQFWNLYKNNKKFLRLSFIDAHEGTGEVISYLDEHLFNFLSELYNKNLLYSTSIFFVSDHGNNMPGYYNIFKRKDFEAEKNLPALFIILPKLLRYKISNKKFQNLVENQQSFITSYDIHDTLFYLINNEHNNYIFSEYGNNLFNKINDTIRNCNFYQEIMIKGSCKCTSF